MGELCNRCGVPETEFVNGKCSACGRSTCDVIRDDLIQKRVYTYADTHGFLQGITFDALSIRTKLESPGHRRKAPAYFRKGVSCAGLSFRCLSEVPVGEVLRVCRDSEDGTFQVGALVWRSAKPSGGLDGLNFIQDAACLDEEFCSEALVGAMFEETSHLLYTASTIK